MSIENIKKRIYPYGGKFALGMFALTLVILIIECIPNNPPYYDELEVFTYANYREKGLMGGDSAKITEGSLTFRGIDTVSIKADTITLSASMYYEAIRHEHDAGLKFPIFSLVKLSEENFKIVNMRYGYGECQGECK